MSKIINQNKFKGKKIHFVGIGGAGMSALAQICLQMGSEVSGSDLKESRSTLSLRRQGAQIFLGHDPQNVGAADIAVYSSAIPSQNCELKAVREKKVLLLSRGEMLARLAQGKKTIAVAGTHGKTTTTSMISLVFEENGLNPTFVIGGELNDIGSNARYGKGQFFVTETDESDGSFLHLKPEVAIITNIDTDHLDYYHSLSEIEKSFLKFIRGVRKKGYLIACGDHPNISPLLSQNHQTHLTYGLKKHNHFYADDVALDKFSASFDAYKEGKRLGKVSLKVPGVHNISNALGTIALSLSLGLSFPSISRALQKFSGVKRRFERIGSFAGITLVDDYAHHPAEVKALLSAAKAGGWNRIICLFQPHRFSRTKYLYPEFGGAFNQADIVVLTDVYPAGENPLPGVSGKLIAEAILDQNPSHQVVYLPKKKDAPSYLVPLLKKGDLLLIAGAGDIASVGEKFSEILQNHEKRVYPAATTPKAN